MRYREIIALDALSTEVDQGEAERSHVLTERTPTKPRPPLTAAKARREQARKARLAAQAQNARDVCARKVYLKQKQMFEDGDR